MQLPYANKSLGQHWLTDTESLAAMASGAEVTSGDTVLEIGPGVGTLTKVLLDAGANVVAVEFDEALAEALPGRLPSDRLTVVMQDILKYNLNDLPKGYKLAANIPYYLTSNLIRVLSESSNPPTHAAILVQKEVAERVAAGPGDMSILAVTAQFYWHVGLGMVVPAKLFTPPPKVDSQILLLQRLPAPLFDVDPVLFFRLVKAGFSNKRKTLLNSLSGGLQRSKPEVATMLESAGIAATRRPQELSMEEWYKLHQTLDMLTINM